jgi:hypothetical protein
MLDDKTCPYILNLSQTDGLMATFLFQILCEIFPSQAFIRVLRLPSPTKTTDQHPLQ